MNVSLKPRTNMALYDITKIYMFYVENNLDKGRVQRKSKK